MHPFRDARRRRLSARPFPPEWDRILERNFPLDRALPAADRAELRRRVRIFLAEKHFEGAGGLDLTEEIRVTIAAQACLLLLHRGEDFYPRLDSIIVYPAAYRVRTIERSADGVVHERDQVRLGEAWNTGAVVLSWEDVRYGAADLHDGHNVVLHEFAHQLDLENNAADGAPELPRRSMYVAWARVLGHEYEQLRHEIERGHRTLMDAYGATNPAEFFAVATETFFERPHALREKHPELYDQLSRFYAQDPVSWVASSREDSCNSE
ncbi:MAG: zinc-dependent peptidase [Gemmatimonadetes bacterium]|nr:zinc-dependent peptidase [Gemmatimonadota bacterium]